MIQEAISSVVSGQSLSADEAVQVMEEIMTGEATPAQFGAFVTALRLKGETPDEIAGMARVMREKALRVQSDGDLVDTCGTGGDGSHTINVSTIAAFVTAGAGLKVAKHGNRAITSACGSADVMEAAGVKVDLGPEGVERCIRDVGIGFMFAPTFHPAMRYAGPPRREIGIRTVFNILGPLTNPAGARSQVLGVADGSLGEKMAMVLLRLGCQHALVVHGEDGLDEISIAAPSQIWELKDGNIYNFAVTPEDLGLSRASASDVQGQSIEDNLAAMNGVLSGEKGPARDIVLLNASAALAAGNAVDNLKQGIMAASESIDSGKAMSRLRALAELSQKLT
jgi:anthranilate phosphoribosyltransferase